MKRGLAALGTVLAALAAAFLVLAPASGADYQASQSGTATFSVVFPAADTPAVSDAPQEATDEVEEPKTSLPEDSTVEDIPLQSDIPSQESSPAAPNQDDTVSSEESAANMSEPEATSVPDVQELSSDVPEPSSTDLPSTALTE